MQNFETPKNIEKLVAPFWRGNTVYEESFLPVLPKGAGKNAPLVISLLYRVSEIVSITTMTRETVFAEEKDYVLNSDGTILIPENSAIKKMPWDEYQIMDENNPYAHYKCKDGGFICFSEGPHFHSMEYCVTYRHNDTWSGFIPQRSENKLSRTRAILKAGKPLNFCFFGDSITMGASSSMHIGIAPHMPIFPVLTVQALEKKYNSEIHYVNHAVGGKTSKWGCERLPLDYAEEKPDIMFIGFGMNDGSDKVPPADFIANIRTMMEQTRALNPECEFLLCSTTLPNELAVRFVGTHEEYEPLLAKLCEEYENSAALVPMTSMHKSLLKKKNFYDMTGNNINHPNDFLVRAYVQTVLSML